MVKKILKKVGNFPHRPGGGGGSKLVGPHILNFFLTPPLEREVAEEAGHGEKVAWCNCRISEEELKKGQVYDKKQIEWSERKRKEVEASLRLRKTSREKRIVSGRITEQIDAENDSKQTKVGQVSLSDKAVYVCDGESTFKDEIERATDVVETDDKIHDSEENNSQIVDDNDYLKCEPDTPEAKQNSVFPVFYLIFRFAVTVSVLTYLHNVVF